MQKTTLTNGGKYNLGACVGTYDARTDSFDVGNTWVHRAQTIYADNADPLFMRDTRAAEIARNAKRDDSAMTPRPDAREFYDAPAEMLG